MIERSFSYFDFKEPDYTRVFKERLDRLKKIRSNPECIPDLKLFYRENIGQFTNDWACTYDPRNVERKLPAVIPFILFEAQHDWMLWLRERWNNGEDGLTEKSRDMGVTWLSVAAATEFFLFQPAVSIGFGSRKEQLVDRIGDADSIFEKIRVYLRLIPKEFLPCGVPDGEGERRLYSEKLDANYMKIRNIENGSIITGEAGDNIGRGGRKSIYFKDESAFYDRPEKIDAALSQTSNCKVDISTPNGVGNPFHQKRVSGALDIFTFHWTKDPRKDEKWYQKQVAVLDPITVAQEIDIDYTASKAGVVIPGKWVQAAINLHENMGLSPSGVTRLGLDVADEEGRDDNVSVTVTGTVVGEIESWKDCDTSQTARRAGALAQSNMAEFVNYDSIGVGAGIRGPSKSIPIPFFGVATSSKKLRGNVIDNSEKLNKDHYENLRAQLWWEMRIRCQRAWLNQNGKKQFSLDEMVSLPNHPQLIAELSMLTYEYTDAGKIKIQSKKELTKSPNFADAVLLAFAPRPLRKTSYVADDYDVEMVV